jgi:cholesterol transport system auxiliary component
MKKHNSNPLILIVALLLSGCGRNSINKNSYALMGPEKITKQQQQDMIIEVRSFSINPLFSSKQLVYRVGEYKYVQDYYNVFLISPAAMITEATKNYLSQSGMFTGVPGQSSMMNSAYIIEGSITQCYADARVKNSPKAVLDIQVFLFKRDKNVDSLQWSKKYDASEAMKDRSAESFIDALNQCLQNVLQKMLDDISVVK